MTTSQGVCETTFTERFRFDECVCGTHPDNLGPCRTYLTGPNKRCVYCDHKLQCHTAISERFDDSEGEKWTLTHVALVDVPPDPELRHSRGNGRRHA